jgi:hypothetical protein
MVFLFALKRIVLINGERAAMGRSSEELIILKEEL